MTSRVLVVGLRAQDPGPVWPLHGARQLPPASHSPARCCVCAVRCVHAACPAGTPAEPPHPSSRLFGPLPLQKHGEERLGVRPQLCSQSPARWVGCGGVTARMESPLLDGAGRWCGPPVPPCGY